MASKLVSIITSLLVAATMAGCADDAPPQATQTTPGAPPMVTATDTTGGIRGVVVDQGIVPIAGALIAVINTDYSTETDDNGNFAISGLNADTYFVEASHPIYNKQQVTVTVVAGEANPPPLKLQLVRQLAFDPYIETVPLAGYISCSANILLPVLGGLLSEECGEGVGSPENTCTFPEAFLGTCFGLPSVDNPVMPGERIGKSGDNNAQLDFYLSNVGVKTLIAEAVWKPSVTLGTGAQQGGFNMGIYTDFACLPLCDWSHQIDRRDGMSPLLLRSDYDAGDDTDYGGDAVLADLNATTETRFSTFTWAAADGTGVLVEQSFDVFVTAAYGLALPEDWSYVSGSEPPF